MSETDENLDAIMADLAAEAKRTDIDNRQAKDDLAVFTTVRALTEKFRGMTTEQKQERWKKNAARRLLRRCDIAIACTERGKISLSETLVDHLVQAVEAFEGSRRARLMVTDRNLDSPSDLRKLTKKAAKDADQIARKLLTLRKSLSTLRYPLNSSIAPALINALNQGFDCDHPSHALDLIKADALIEFLAPTLQKVSRVLSEAHSASGGPNAQHDSHDLDRFIAELSEIYTRAGGRVTANNRPNGSPGSRFINFVLACVQAAKLNSLSINNDLLEDALRNRIKRLYDIAVRQMENNRKADKG